MRPNGVSVCVAVLCACDRDLACFSQSTGGSVSTMRVVRLWCPMCWAAAADDDGNDYVGSMIMCALRPREPRGCSPESLERATALTIVRVLDIPAGCGRDRAD